MARQHSYLVALGSNVRHVRYGDPRGVVRAAIEALAGVGKVVAASRVVSTAPLGPSRRRFANAVVVLNSDHDPPTLLKSLQHIEQVFGRRRGGQAWRARVLDLDIVLWSGGMWASPDLVMPHPHMRERAFVLGPSTKVAAHWREPLSGLTVRQLQARLTKPRPVLR